MARLTAYFFAGVGISAYLVKNLTVYVALPLAAS